jgi:hypothetical protein
MAHASLWHWGIMNYRRCVHAPITMYTTCTNYEEEKASEKGNIYLGTQLYSETFCNVQTEPHNVSQTKVADYQCLHVVV